MIVVADAERLRQVIDNLIGNAIRHTPDGSPVTVTVAGELGRGRLTVADRGPGMTTEQASRVFERFYRTDDARTRASGGTGLGLAIASSLAAAHGGELTVDTEPGHGAAFHLRLPQPETLQATATIPKASSLNRRSCQSHHAPMWMSLPAFRGSPACGPLAFPCDIFAHGLRHRPRHLISRLP